MHHYKRWVFEVVVGELVSMILGCTSEGEREVVVREKEREGPW